MYPQPVVAMQKHAEKLEEDLKNLGLKVKQHEDTMKLLKTELSRLEVFIAEMRVSIGKYHASHVAAAAADCNLQDERQIDKQVSAKDKTAAGIICQLKTRHYNQMSKLNVTKDVLGVVAALGKVDDDNLSRLFAEYLGMDTMLGIVCKTFEGVKALEQYDGDSAINKDTGLHGVGSVIGRILEGRYIVFCLENLRPFAGEFVAGDPQKRLALLKPRFPNGESPPGFIGFAVNMINLEDAHLSCVTPNGHGLRETLFYSLLSRLQVYQSRAQMEKAIPCISDGAISLDGGIIKSNGVYLLGSCKDIDIRFPMGSIPNLPTSEFENQIKVAEWEMKRLSQDMQIEEVLLKNAKKLFSSKQQEFENFLREAESSLEQGSAGQVISFGRPPRKGTPNKRWTPQQDEKLIEFLAEQCREGKKVDKGFKKPTFVTAANYINEKFNTDFTAAHVDHHFRTLRQRYLLIKFVLSLNGASWNDELQMVILDKETKRDLTKSNPKLEPFINTPIRQLEELRMICGDDEATRDFAKTVYDDYGDSISDSGEQSNAARDNTIKDMNILAP